MLSKINHLFSLNKSGISRGEFIKNFVIVLVLGAFIQILPAIILSYVGPRSLVIVILIICAVVAILCVYVFWVSVIKRLVDIGVSRWLALLFFVPLINLGFLIYLVVSESKSTSIANQI